MEQYQITWKNYYTILKIRPTSSSGTVTSAYRKLAFENHPDRVGGGQAATAKMAEINEAYAILCKPGKRALYDLEFKKRQPAKRSTAANKTPRAQRSRQSDAQPAPARPTATHTRPRPYRKTNYYKYTTGRRTGTGSYAYRAWKARKNTQTEQVRNPAAGNWWGNLACLGVGILVLWLMLTNSGDRGETAVIILLLVAALVMPFVMLKIISAREIMRPPKGKGSIPS